MVCEMCHRKGTTTEIHSFEYSSVVSFLGGFEMPYTMVYTMHEACVNNEDLRKVER